MVELAQELIDAIIDEVAATDQYCQRPDRKSLQACALASPAFLASSQRRLFQSLAVKTEWRGMVDAFSAAPHLASYARDVYLDFTPLQSGDDILMARLFTLLCGVERLVISTWGTFQWDSFDGVLSSMLALPSLRCFGFTYCDGVPASLIRHALSSYEEVVLMHVGISANNLALPQPPRDVDRRNASLKHLAVSPHAASISDTLVLIRDDPSLQHIEHLELCLSKQGTLDGFEEIVLKCSDSLQHLVINFSKLHDDPIDLPCIPNLRFLTLKASVRKLRLPWSFQDIMATLPQRMPHLEVLTITIDAEFEDYWTDRTHRPDVDEALKKLLGLRDVHFSISTGYPKELEFHGGIAEKLPMASGAGLVSFSRWHVGRLYHPMTHFSN
ncbi:hypothetical protein MVEN_01098300 [Mycena venus]|uniref:Uncharacterized protein n=1 Tax=Mycena venus TaxID=2733690 RepID=A0A8H6Y957_9AGAR|nr:hypothetical protein MVEN_01098300 [Mycena venus]